LEKPVIAAVNGVAAGGGCDIALACDIRIASERARFGEVFARLGLFPGTGGTYFLPRIVGIAKALELIWTGDVIDAWEAERLGLVSRVVPPESLMADTVALAQRLAQGPPLAISLAKSAVYKGLDLDIYSAFEYAATAESITLMSADHQEGIRAFREKRPPNFQGR
jgi:2-(1,2-epoxy-1,2-dihydrophenyl)acetyl-CoA isomerase